MTVTSEYVFLNPKLDEIYNILENTKLEHDNYGGSRFRKIEVK